MRTFFKLYKIEQKQFFRSPDVFIFNICMPVVTLFIIALIAGAKQTTDNISFLESAFCSLSTVGIICSAFMSIPIVITDYRDKKILKHFYCSPCSVSTLLGVDTLSSGIMSVVSTLLVAFVAVAIFGYRMQGNVLVFIGCWLLTTISMFSIGLMVASVCRTVKSLNVVTSLLYFPMLLFSGATIPYEIFPTGLQAVAKVMPLGVGIRLLKAASIGANLLDYTGNIVILAAIAVVCTVIAIKTFRWE